MGLRTKFNLVLGAIFLLGLLIAGYISYAMELRQAREEAMQNATLILAMALATREYTVQEVRPLLQEQQSSTFLPQTVPAYAANQTFARLSEDFPEYTYREVALNPMNPRNRADAWEVGIIREFRNHDNETALIGNRSTDNNELMYSARPIKITNEACLQCHGTPEEAPESLVKLYGESNGFGWQFGEIVGSQIVSVPTSLATQKARDSVFTLLVSLIGVFFLIFIVVNTILYKTVIVPLTRISKITDQISLGNMDIDEFPASRADDIGAIEKSINRLKRSLEKAMKMVEDQDVG